MPYENKTQRDFLLFICPISNAEILRDDKVGKGIFRGYEDLDEQDRDQLKSFTDWLNEEAKKKREVGNN